MAICPDCQKEMLTGAGCTIMHIKFSDGTIRDRLRHFGQEKCGDCGVASGGIHHQHCDMEKCPKCAGQYLTCKC